jgi:membrane fusion protein, multidrug efflux system
VRVRVIHLLAALLSACLLSGCRADATGETDKSDKGGSPQAAAPIPVTVVEVTEQPLVRHIQASGTLTADEQAQVASEIAGRVVATPVERGSRVGAGGILVRVAATEAEAQADEAQANAAQLEARLAISGEAPFAVDRVPEVASARASADLAQSEFERAEMLMDRQLVSKAEFDQKRTQAEAARRQYEVARNSAQQQYQALLAARARVALARKALADTVVRAPFDGVVAERLVSVGDYVVKGTKVATVMRTTPLRVELTVPQSDIAAVAVGRDVEFNVDAYPGRMFTGRVRFVSPAVRADSRSLVVEAVVPNETGELKPGLFATARIEKPERTPAMLLPRTAIGTVADTSRIYVVEGGRGVARLITLGQTVGDQVEITSGVKRGELVAVTALDRLADGSPVTIVEKAVFIKPPSDTAAVATATTDKPTSAGAPVGTR